MVDMTDWYDDFISEEKSDEKIVELTDIADEKDASAQEDLIELKDIAHVEKESSIQEDIIELTDITEGQSPVLELDSIKEEKVEPEEALELGEGIIFKEELELEDEISFNEDHGLKRADLSEDAPFESDVSEVPGMDLSMTSEQLETALERVIEKRFADKIDILLTEGMERVIKKEIAEIKERLQKDLNQMGNV